MNHLMRMMATVMFYCHSQLDDYIKHAWILIDQCALSAFFMRVFDADYKINHV